MTQLYDATGQVLEVSGVSANSVVKIPFWDTPTQPNTWAGSTMKSEEFLTTFYDPYVKTYADGYTVTKTSLGFCGDGVRSIYEYVFAPANYTRTIILSALMHAQEIAAGFAMGRFVHYLMNEYENIELFKYLHENVRIVILPLQNPNGFDQNPRRFGTPTLTESSLGVNVNSNFDSKVDRWQDLKYDSLHPVEWNAKGAKPFSEAETQVLVATLKRYLNDAEFWIDCHTGSGWDEDVWYYYIEQDNILKPKAIAASEWLSEKFAADKGVSVSALKNRIEDRVTSHKLRYAVTELGIPCLTIEHVPGRCGGTECGSMDLKVYLRHLSALVTAGLNTGGKTLGELQNEIKTFKLQKAIENLEYFNSAIKTADGKTYLQSADANGNAVSRLFEMY